MSNDAKPPKVFVSYSWTSPEHEDWVEKLAERLSSDGVHVVFDKWDLKEGQDKYVFMEQMVLDPDVKRVLAICDKAYQEKANARKGGVGTESLIISKEVYDKASQDKFIPIIRDFDADGKPCVPVFFGGRIHIDLSTDDKFADEYDRLLRNIFDRPARKRPPLGTPPSYLFTEEPLHLKTSHKLDRVKKAVAEGKKSARSLIQDYIETFVAAYEDFRIETPIDKSMEVDDLVMEKVDAFRPYRDEMIDFFLFAGMSLEEDEAFEIVADLLERIEPFHERPASVTSWSEWWFDNYKFVNYELVLYLFAALIKSRRFKLAARLLGVRLHVPSELGGAQFHTVGIEQFGDYIRSLEETRKQRLNLNVYSVPAMLVQQRADRKEVPFHSLVQADFMMFLAGCFAGIDQFCMWYPRLAPYLPRDGALELFARASSERGFAGIRDLLQVKDLKDFLVKFLEARKNQVFQRVVSGDRFWRIDLVRLLNLDVLQKAAGM